VQTHTQTHTVTEAADHPISYIGYASVE